MILDYLDHAEAYRRLDAGITTALEYLRAQDITQLPDGRHALDGERMFALVQRYTPKPPEQAGWEAHRKYSDVQYIVAGNERMGHLSLRPGLPVKTAYNADQDVVFYDARGNWFDLSAGQFVIFRPWDIHAPGVAPLAPASPQKVWKVVLKVRTA